MRGFRGRKERENCEIVLSSQKIKNNKISQDIKNLQFDEAFSKKTRHI